MKTTVNFNDFVDGFQKMGRENQFSYDGLKLIFDYLESEEIEFDPIGICCTYTEYTLDEFNVLIPSIRSKSQNCRLTNPLWHHELVDTIRRPCSIW
jgi:hypothetical protein